MDTFEGTEEIQQLVISRAISGLRIGSRAAVGERGVLMTYDSPRS
jgi:hypothetical protein